MPRRRGFSCRDGSTDCRQCGAIIEVDTGSIRWDSKLHPQLSRSTLTGLSFIFVYSG